MVFFSGIGRRIFCKVYEGYGMEDRALDGLEWLG
jgi:hypothetical protein